MLRSSRNRACDAGAPVRLGELMITHNCRRHLDAQDINPLHYLMAHCSREAMLPPPGDGRFRQVSRFDLNDGETLYIVSDPADGETTLMLTGDWAALQTVK